ncbi:MAG: DUF2252 domain-containing protein [Bacteroidota bacterium]|nr:DUF2252 domain-containing protein [Bacteroidota bacterium]
MHHITQRILEFNRDARPELAQLKYKLMSENAFRFFRGTCHIFYEDLHAANNFPMSPVSWLCGDLHVENFGSYKGDNRLVYFDLNDFDEAILGPLLWDVVRMTTSIFLAFDSLRITDKQALEAVSIFLEYFTNTLFEGNARYIEPQTATGIVKKFLNVVSERTQKELIGERARMVKGTLRLDKSKDKHLKINKALKKELIENFIPWMRSNNAPPNDYNVLDVCFRIAGTGSVGVERYLFLIQKVKDLKKFMLIDMKEATSSSLLPYIQQTQPQWASEAERIISVQKRMQNISPAQLSVNLFHDRSYVMQEMQPIKDRINFQLIQNDFKKICCVMDDMAVIAASSYLSSSGRQGSSIADDLIKFAGNKEWHNAVIDYSLGYSHKVKTDFDNYCADHKNFL